jgi:hypothetical protein
LQLWLNSEGSQVGDFIFEGNRSLFHCRTFFVLGRMLRCAAAMLALRGLATLSGLETRWRGKPTIVFLFCQKLAESELGEHWEEDLVQVSSGNESGVVMIMTTMRRQGMSRVADLIMTTMRRQGMSRVADLFRPLAAIRIG